MNRREILKTAVLGTSAALGSGGRSMAAQPIPPSAGAAGQAGKERAWKPLLFDDHQNETVISLSARIMPATDTPGAKEANVNRYIDLILHDGDHRKRNSFLEGLGWLDGYAIRLHDAPFVRCSAEQQVELLKTLEGASDPNLKIGAQFFEQIKQLTIQGYYTSKIGIDELNKHGVPETFGCPHEDHG